MIEINQLIATAMKERRKDELEVYRLIKSEFVKAEKNGIVLNDIEMAKILLKMAAQREDAFSQYVMGNRMDLADKEKFETEVINSLLPKQPTEEELEEYTRACITAYKASSDTPISMRDMKPLLTLVQEKYPSANGKIVSKVLKEIINS